MNLKKTFFLTLTLFLILFSSSFLSSFSSLFSNNVLAQERVFLLGKQARTNEQTCGGLFIWQDVAFFQEWHIQRSILTGDFRLLDPDAVCRAAGTLDFCQKELNFGRSELEIPPMNGRVLILVHGFASSSILLENMALWFREKGDYSAILNISYPSTFVTVEEETAQIAQIVTSLEGVESVDFVGHSMGAIILRNLLGKYTEDASNIQNEQDEETAEDARDDENAENTEIVKNAKDVETVENGDDVKEKWKAKKFKVGRFVQVCPPNQGSNIAQNHNAGPIGFLFPALEELSLSGTQMHERFGIPSCEFGIIAGYGEDANFGGEENDAVLPLSTTKLEGATAWRKIRGDHSEVPNRVETFENVRNFLNTGDFLSENH